VLALGVALEGRGLVTGLPLERLGGVRASLSIVSARVRASLTMLSDLVRASERSCSDLVRASVSIPSASDLASAVSRSAISWARPRTFAACTWWSPPLAPPPPWPCSETPNGGGTTACCVWVIWGWGCCGGIGCCTVRGASSTGRLGGGAETCVVGPEP
jgi:hypothetical protein